MARTSPTGMRDEHYDIVSALYHTLQSAQRCSQYINDAEKEGDQEVAQFFHDMQDSQRRLADKAQQLLSERVR